MTLSALLFLAHWDILSRRYGNSFTNNYLLTVTGLDRFIPREPEVELVRQ